MTISAAVSKTLESHPDVDPSLAALALNLAGRLDAGPDTDQAAAVLSKELRATLAAIAERVGGEDSEFDRFVADLSAEIRDPSKS